MKRCFLAASAALLLSSGGPACALDAVEETISRSDLAAQEGMWRAADRMVLATLLQVVIGTAGTIAVVVSLVQSRSAVELTRRTLALQHQTAHHELRAYISIVVKDEGLDENGKGRLSAKIRNYGQTPAVNVQSWSRRKWIDGVPPAVDMGFPATMRLRPWRDIAPGGDADIFRDVSLTTSDMGELKARKKSQLEYGAILYEDIFGQRHCFTYSYIRYGERLEYRKRNSAFKVDHPAISEYLNGGACYHWPELERAPTLPYGAKFFEFFNGVFARRNEPER